MKIAFGVRTLRFLLPVVCALGCGAEMKMHGRLPERPLSPLWEELERCGIPRKKLDATVILVNGKNANKRSKLTDGDTVTLMSPVAGG